MTSVLAAVPRSGGESEGLSFLRAGDGVSNREGDTGAHEKGQRPASCCSHGDGFHNLRATKCAPAKLTCGNFVLLHPLG